MRRRRWLKQAGGHCWGRETVRYRCQPRRSVSAVSCGGCGRSSMVELQPSKLVMRVRFPSPAPRKFHSTFEARRMGSSVALPSLANARRSSATGTVAPGHEGMGAVCGPLRQPDVFDVIGGEYRSLGTRQQGTTINGDRARRVDRAPAAPLLAARQMALAPCARCSACGQRTGLPPLAVELTTALLLGALAARVHPGLVPAAACWLALCSVPLAFIGAAVRRLPYVLTGSAFAGTAALLLAAAAARRDLGCPSSRGPVLRPSAEVAVGPG